MMMSFVIHASQKYNYYHDFQVHVKTANGEEIKEIQDCIQWRSYVRACARAVLKIFPVNYCGQGDSGRSDT